MADRSFLTWPFFEDHHRTLADNLEAWAAANLSNNDHDDIDVATQELVRLMGDAGWLQYSGSNSGKLSCTAWWFVAERGMDDGSFASEVSSDYIFS